MPEALNFAYSMEAKKVLPRTTLERIPRGTSGLTIYERIAEGILIKGMALRSMPTKELRHVIGLRYRRRADRHLRILHDYDVRVVAEACRKENSKLPTKWFVMEILMRWAGHRTRHKDVIRWWSNHLEIGEKRIQSFMYGDGSIYYLLNSWLGSAESYAGIVFEDKGVVGY